MKMDTLFWTQLNPNIKIKPTTKLAFGKYLYKVEFECPGVSFLRGEFATLDEFCQNRELLRHMNWGGSWLSRRRAMPTSEQKIFLTQLRELTEEYPQLKRRVEDPMIQFYSDDLQDLMKFVKQVNAHEYLVAVTLPYNNTEKRLLEQGLVVRTKTTKWKYRFHIREARYSWETRQQLLQYLQNLGDAVHVPTQLLERLSDPKASYIWGGYIDAEDANLATVIHLIGHNIIRSIDEFHEVDRTK